MFFLGLFGVQGGDLGKSFRGVPEPPELFSGPLEVAVLGESPSCLPCSPSCSRYRFPQFLPRQDAHPWVVPATQTALI